MAFYAIIRIIVAKVSWRDFHEDRMTEKKEEAEK